MPDADSNSPGFSRGRRWLTTLNLLVASAAVLAMLVMVNYVAQGHFRRYPLANYTNYKLSPQTLRVLNSLTNDVKVTIFYERSQGGDVYAMICGLLAEYQNASRHIQVTNVDYVTSPGEAIALRGRLKLTRADEKDFVAFESNGHSKICKGDELSDFNIDEILGGKSRDARRTTFKGEAKFTDLIFAVSYPRPMKAYFLAGHGERDPGQPGEKPTSEQNGISKLAAILKDEIDCDWQRLFLTGTNPIPEDCKLLIIASPRLKVSNLSSNELAQIQTYLQHDNGRLLALLDTTEGLDPILGDPWGVVASPGWVLEGDKNFQLNDPGLILAAPAVDQEQQIHDIVKPLAKEGLPVEMVFPHAIGRSGTASKVPGAPTLSPLLSTSTNAMLFTNSPNGYLPVTGLRRNFPLAMAIEHGVLTGGDGTRIVVAGDADFLSDPVIDNAANYYFARLTLNWLLHRPEIALKGLGPSPIKEYRLVLTQAQTRQMQWLFLAVMPGAVLLLGGLVWLRRRS
jgi:hypothetical protein